jgi:hypothetical protein
MKKSAAKADTIFKKSLAVMMKDSGKILRHDFVLTSLHLNGGKASRKKIAQEFMRNGRENIYHCNSSISWVREKGFARIIPNTNPSIYGLTGAGRNALRAVTARR